MSYRKKHIKNKIYKQKPKKSIFKRLWFWLLLLFVVFIIGTAYFLTFYSGVQVKSIAVSGNEKVNAEDVRNAALNSANTVLVKLWNFKLTSNSIFFVNNEKISKGILEKFPKVGKVKVSKQLPQTLNISLNERKPIGAFCDNSNQCFSIDEDGIIFEPASNTDNITIVRQITNDKQVLVGNQAIAKTIIDTIYKIQKNLEDKLHINLQEALITSPIRLNIKTSENWQIYFDLSSDITSQLSKLNLLFDTEISPENRKDLRYIDLRPEHRAIICDNAVCGK